MIDVVSSLNKNIEYVDNIFIVIENKELVITKYGTCTRDIFFRKIKSNDKALFYNALSESFITRYLRADVYHFDPFYGKRYLPFIYKPLTTGKNKSNTEFYLCALIDIDNLYKNINVNNDQNFYIVYNNEYIYASNQEYLPTIENIHNESNLVKQETGYVLCKKFTPNGLVYAKFCPIDDIVYQVSRINAILFFLMIAVLIIVVAISLFFSFKFNDPIAKITKEILSSSDSNIQSIFNFSTSLSEINLAITKLKAMYEENKRIGKELSHKNSLLKYYFTIAKLKNIHNIELDDDLSLNYTNYVVVVCKLLFKPDFYKKFENNQEKALDFLKHFLNNIISDNFTDSITYQIENKQFISIINLHDKDRNDVIKTLNYAVELMMNDKEYFTITLACSNKYNDTSQLNAAYSEAFNLIKYRKLTEEHQIVLKEDTLNSKFYFSISQEKQISEAMFNNDKELMISLINKVLDENYTKNVSSYYFNKLTIEIINNFVKVLNIMKIDPSEIFDLESMYEQLENFYIIDNYKDLLIDAVGKFSNYISKKKPANDYINDFIVNYINKNYNQDISLDLLSEKLNLSPNYISAYFKINNGMNFLDYLHTVRINKAKELLKISTIKIQDIAAQTGYNSVHSFIRTFKRYTGKTPSKFRSEICN